eukprot:6195228-Pleurochrysis_carterae.AAC.1
MARRHANAWRAGMRDWEAFERAYAQHASYENSAEAIGHLRSAMESLRPMTDGGVCARGLGTGTDTRDAAAHALGVGELELVRRVDGSRIGELRLHVSSQSWQKDRRRVAH